MPGRMTRRPGARAALVALAFVAMAILPLAGADHAYSHRYIVYGRVVDAENNPVGGLTTDLGYEKPFTPEGPCASQPGTETDAFGPTRQSPVTNQFGEFIFCFHTHAMSRTTPGVGILSVPALEVEERFEFDGYMRYSFLLIKLPSAHPDANKTVLDEFYTVHGRAWRPTGADTRVESVRVYGDTLHNMPVNVTLTADGKEPVRLSTRTNNYGDFSIRIPVTSRPSSGEVTMEIDNQTFRSPVENTGITSFRAEIPKTRDPFVAKLLLGLGVVAAVVVGGGAVWYASNRLKASRDERVRREGSTRKRANK